MKNVLAIALMLLTSTAFIGLIVDQNFANINVTLKGDEHAQVMWGVIDCILLTFVFFHGRQFVRVASRQPAILAFITWSALSVAWSDDPQLSLRRILGLICTMAMGFFLGMKFEMRELLRLLAWTMAIAMIASIIGAVFFPSFGVMASMYGAWRGVFSHKNELGHEMGMAIIAFICLFWESWDNRPIYLVLLTLSVVLLLFSKSVSAIIVTGLTLFIWLYRALRLRPAQRVAFIAIVLLAGLAGGVFVQSRMDSILATMGRDTTLTGRVPLWQLSAEAILKRPMLGAGWDAFWPGTGGDYIRSLSHWAVPHAHNGFLEMALNIGLVGLAIFLICNLDCYRRALRYGKDARKPLHLWPILFYSFTILFYFTEAPPVDRHSLSFVLFCAISVSMTEARRVEAMEHEPEEEHMPSVIVSDSNLVEESQ